MLRGLSSQNHDESALLREVRAAVWQLFYLKLPCCPVARNSVDLAVWSPPSRPVFPVALARRLCHCTQSNSTILLHHMYFI